MAGVRITVAVRARTLKRLDGLIDEGVFSSRSAAVEAVEEDVVAWLSGGRLAREAATVDPLEEKALAEEGIVSRDVRH